MDDKLMPGATALICLVHVSQCGLQEEQAAALLTGPSDVSGSSSQALPNIEKEQLLARIQQLEAAGLAPYTDWQQPHGSVDDDDERRRYTQASSQLHAACRRQHRLHDLDLLAACSWDLTTMPWCADARCFLTGMIKLVLVHCSSLSACSDGLLR